MFFPMSILASPQHPGSWTCRYIVPGATHDAVASVAGPGSHIPSPGSQFVFFTFCIQVNDLLSLMPVLLQRFQDHLVAQARNIIRHEPDQVGFHTDIGTQDRLMLSPRLFRKYIKPLFKTVFQTYRKAGVHVYLHSDGHLLEIVDDLVECGVSVHVSRSITRASCASISTLTGKPSLSRRWRTLTGA
jgi:hypothetical protein